MAIEIVDLPIHGSVIFYSYVSLAEGNHWDVRMISFYKDFSDSKKEYSHCRLVVVMGTSEMFGIPKKEW